MAIENGVIILEGNIGAGKTTLAHKISAAIKRMGLKSQTHEEPASGTNPFLDDYYKDPKATAFKMQNVHACETLPHDDECAVQRRR